MSKPFVIWLTGFSGSGKTTIAELLQQKLKKLGVKVDTLDGDEIRKIFPNTGFSREAREFHVERVAHVASVLEKNDVSVIVSLVSPYRNSRDFARKICQNFIEVHVCTPIEVCQKRDPKGLYQKAVRGEIKNFTGLSQDYEAPLNPELKVDTSGLSMEESAQLIMSHLNQFIS